MANDIKAKCRHCGNDLEPGQTGPCPHCGQSGREVIAVLNRTLHLKASVSSEEGTLAYFEWLNRKADAYYVALAAVVLVVLATTAIADFVGGGFAALLGALIAFTVGQALAIATTAYLTRHAKRLAGGTARKEAEAEEARLWRAAARDAHRNRALRFSCWGSGFVPVFLGFAVWYFTTEDVWLLKEGLDYAAVVFIAWAGIVHLSDRLFMDRSASIAASITHSELAMHDLTDLVARRRIGFISASFLAMGFLLEIARFVVEKVGL